MNYRQFGNTELKLSEIGFGAWAIGGSAMVGDIPIGWGDADDATSVKAIHAALDAGINFFDTADFYGLGHSEELLGKTLAGNREVFIASKAGQRNLDEKVTGDYSYDYLISACEASLKRLKRDHIDLLQLHTVKAHHLEEGSCIAAMEKLKQQGKIRYWGVSVSTFAPQPEAEILFSKNVGSGIQVVFNLINHISLDIIREAHKKGYGVIARMPLQFGLLTGKFRDVPHFDKNDHRSFRITPEIVKIVNQMIDNIWLPEAKKTGKTLTEFALSFILSMKEISTVIPGLRTSQQVNANTKNLSLLPADVMQQLLASDPRRDELIELMRKQG